MPRQWIHSEEGKGPICPVCNQTGLCRISTDLVACARVEAGSIRPLDDGSGWMHRLQGKKLSAARKIAGQFAPLTPGQIKAMIAENAGAIDSNALEAFAKSIKLQPAPLLDLGIGWDAKMQAWSFPMLGKDSKPVGLHYVWDDGREGFAEGGQDGLFIPESYGNIPTSTPWGECLLILTPQGIRDTASALEMGFRCIGRPWAMKGRELLREFLRAGGMQDIVIVADNFEIDRKFPGLEGSLFLAAFLLDSCKTVRFIVPPSPLLSFWEWSHTENNRIFQSLADAKPINRNWLDVAFKRLESKMEKVMA